MRWQGLRLYLLKRTDHVGYGEVAGYVIRARSKKRAMKMAGACPGQWECEFLGYASGSKWEKEEELLQDYRSE